MRSSQLLCVGSGLTPRYRLNTLQALALPSGAYLQFRYLAELVSEQLKTRLEAGALDGISATLGHVDTTPEGRLPGGRCPIIPYRRATLVGSRKVGTVYILQFNLGKFEFSSSLDEFQQGLPSDVPHWTDEGKLAGLWCQELPQQSSSISQTDSLEVWQSIVKQLKSRRAFAEESYFCTIEGLFERNTKMKMAPVKGEYVLGADKEFELRIFHYDPDSDAHSGYKQTRWLRLTVAQPWIQLRTTPLIAIDSPYDLKSIQIGTGSTVLHQYSSLVLKDEATIESAGKDPKDDTLALFLPVKITGSVWRNAALALVLGFMLTMQQLVSLLSKPETHPAPIIVLLTVLLGMLTGVVAVFGLRRSV